MKATSALCIILLAVITLISSCAPSYIPNVINTPLLSNKGEFQASTYLGTSGADPQLAYALTNNIGIMANGSFWNQSSDSTVNYHNHNLYELGVGYYTKLTERNRFECFLGGGIGDINSYTYSDIIREHANANYTKIFIQPTYGSTREIVDVIGVSRLSLINITENNNTLTGVFFEPAITVKVGYKFIKASFQFGTSIPLNSEGMLINHRPIIIGIGVQANLWKIYNSEG